MSIYVEVPGRKKDVGSVVTSFNRVGILVDDVDEAESRLAIELYATTSLPNWWIIARTVEDAVVYLRDLEDVLAEDEDVPWFVILDRYLPIASGLRAEPWWTKPEDGPATALHDIEITKALRDVVIRLEQLGRVLGISAFPTLPDVRKPKSGIKELEWHSRSDAPVLTRLRGDLATAVDEDLLTFGPLPSLEKGQWTEVLSDLVHRLKRSDQEEESVVLLSGAGMSRRDSDARDGSGAGAAAGVGAGMVDNRTLMAASVRWALRRHPSEGKRKNDPGGDIVNVAELKNSFRRILLNDQSKFAHEVVSFVNRRGQEWGEASTFNLLWGEKLTQPEIKKFREDVELGIRVVVTANDRGVTHQHFLAAQLPFTRIITTNFDGQHERAAVLVASRNLDEAPKYIPSGLAVGDPFSDNKPTSVAPRLLRLYGSVASGQALAIETAHFKSMLEDSLPDLHKAINKLDRTLVIVGHSLDDEALISWLTTLDFTKIVYVAVGAGVSIDVPLDAPSANAKSHFLKDATLIDCRAIDFFFDLAVAYKEGQRTA